MKLSTLLATIPALLVLASIAPAAALARPGGDPLHRLESAVAAADLDAETAAGVYEILDQARSDQRAQRGELRDAHRALHALLEQDEPDEKQVLAQVDVIGELETAQRKSGLETLLQVRSRLSAAQWEQLRDSLHRRGRFHGEGPAGGCSEK